MNPRRPYEPPKLVTLAPDDPRAARLRAELAALDRLAVDFDPLVGGPFQPRCK